LTAGFLGSGTLLGFANAQSGSEPAVHFYRHISPRARVAAFSAAMRECAESFAAIREAVGEVQWRQVLEGYGWTGFPDIRKALDAKSPGMREKVAECFSHLDAIARKAVA
jgi:hypothetical protein